jgi:hypothetical protein
MNLMVQSKFNLVFWFVSYSIFFIVEQVGPSLIPPHALVVAAVAAAFAS